MTPQEIRSYFNNKPVEFVIRENYELKEDKEYIPRFTLKNAKEISNIPINEPIKPTIDIIIKAIKYGMIFLISYKGAKDNLPAGHERVIYPMVIGRSSKGKILVRGYHLNGWSVSANRHIDKIWRMFRLDRVLSITFTGSFYRLPPAGYNMNDKGMRGGIIARADFNEIRRNQQTLVKANQIQNKEEITLGEEGRTFISVRVKSTETQLDLTNPLDNAYVNNVKDIANVRISFLKSIYGNKYVAILGAMGKPGNTVKLTNEKGTQLGVFKVLDSIGGSMLKRIKNVKGNSIFDVYIFDKKM
jgi:hypothetical protein